LRRSLWVVASLTAIVVGTVVLRRVVSLVDARRLRGALDVLRARVAAPEPAEPQRASGSSEAGAILPAMEPPSAVSPVGDAPAAVLADDVLADLTRASFRAGGASGAGGARGSGVLLATAAAVAGILALALGSWSFYTLTRESDREPTAEQVDRLVEQAVALLANPATQRIAFDGSNGGLTVVVTSDGDALLVITNLKAVPEGKTYQAWVIHESRKPQPAGVFSGRSKIVPLKRPVPPGATVAITLEREGGAPAPTQAPKLVARRT
jgi:anti-sigma-K factor RskA